MKLPTGAIVIGSGAVLLLAVIPFAAFVWPTIYRYDHMNYSGNVLPVRVHRITGRTDVLDPSLGWVVVDGESSAERVELKPLPADQVRKVQGTAGVHSSNLNST